MKSYSVLIILAAAAISLRSFAAPIPVALLSDEPGVASTDIREKLLASGLFSVVDYFNIGTTNLEIGVTPTVLQLQQYASVLVYTALNAYSDPIALGNNLAAYVDGGGGVVEAVFSNADQPMQGNLSRSPYVLIRPGGGLVDPELTLGILDSSHPIMTGVHTFNGGSNSFRSGQTVPESGTTIAVWQGPGANSVAPLVVVKDIGSARRVDLNFYPPSDAVGSGLWRQDTDGAILMANAVSWAGHGAVVPEPGSIALLLVGVTSLLNLRKRHF